MKIVYAVEIIEIDFGQRPEGYSLYLNKDECIERTKKTSETGSYGDGGNGGVGYYGPIRPLAYVEVPWDSLEEDLQTELTKKNRTHTSNSWSPRYGSKIEYI